MTAYVIRGVVVTAVAAAPLTLPEDEILIRSADEIAASGLPRAQLAAIWNARPGNHPISRFQDKSAARRLWAAFQELPRPSEVAAAAAPASQQAEILFPPHPVTDRLHGHVFAPTPSAVIPAKAGSIVLQVTAPHKLFQRTCRFRSNRIAGRCILASSVMARSAR